MQYEGTYSGNAAIDQKFKCGGLIPIPGFGTGTDYKNRCNDAGANMVVACKAGYRLFDTAQVCLRKLFLYFVNSD